MRKVGNNLGLILPKQLVEELHLKTGDKLSIEKKVREWSCNRLIGNSKVGRKRIVSSGKTTRTC
ncbi:MAG: AbrB/MazE/SpoVT family DNA-binding domain-containing protein [Bacteroidota bacterium]